MNMRGGYQQYLSNTPYANGYGLGNVQLTSGTSGLANPPPYTPYTHCEKNNF